MYCMRLVHAAAFCLLIPTLSAQPTGETRYSKHCESCHGTDAYGGDQGPALANNRGLRRRSFAEIRGIIRNGKPDSGMPAFNLPDRELDDIARFIHSLNAPAASAHLPGDRAAGERFFFGEGKCSTCHMIA